MKNNVYIFSGLGADERVFQKLNLSDYSICHVQWITPQDNESIENYAKRLIEQITTKRPVLIGLSFGGLIAIEVAKHIETEKIILIASAKTQNEIPFYYRWAGRFGLHKLLSPTLLMRSNFISNWLFGASSASDKQLLKEILSDTDPVFLIWAMDKIVSWKNTSPIKNTRHIHGTADKILPFRFISCDHRIKNGGHFMTVNKPKEVAEILRLILQK